MKVTELDIIVTMIDNEPYYEIKYKKVGDNDYKIGYSSYRLKTVLEYKEKYFEIVNEEESMKKVEALKNIIALSNLLNDLFGVMKE